MIHKYPGHDMGRSDAAHAFHPVAISPAKVDYLLWFL